MSQTEPRRPYVFQPDPPRGTAPAAEQRIWSVGGPGTGTYTGVGQRYTRSEAQAIVDGLLLAGVGRVSSFLGGV